MRHILIMNTADQPVIYESRPSSTLDLIALLPFLPVANRYPGLHPWAQGLTERLSPEEQADYALIARALYTALKHLGIAMDQVEDAPAFLAALAGLPAEQYQLALLRGCSSESNDEELRTLRSQPERMREALLHAWASGLEEETPLDIERLAEMAARPAQLKELIAGRLEALWSTHLRGHWERSLPDLHRRADEARKQFRSGTAEQVIPAVTGKQLPEILTPLANRFRKVIFYPSSFLGPYATMMHEEPAHALRTIYGGGFRPTDAELETGLPGSMLPILTALADEARLQMLGLIRSRGQGCAQDFMAEFGLSQPATSRHLRLLESTGLVKAERIDGVKWYRINPTRAMQIGESLQRLLLGE